MLLFSASCLPRAVSSDSPDDSSSCYLIFVPAFSQGIDTCGCAESKQASHAARRPNQGSHSDALREPGIPFFAHGWGSASGAREQRPYADGLPRSRISHNLKNMIKEGKSEG